MRGRNSAIRASTVCSFKSSIVFHAKLMSMEFKSPPDLLKDGGISAIIVCTAFATIACLLLPRCGAFLLLRYISMASSVNAAPSVAAFQSAISEYVEYASPSILANSHARFNSVAFILATWSLRVMPWQAKKF